MLSYLSKKNYFFTFIIFIFGILISRIVSYGDDLDFLGLIHTFINVIENGTYTPSRFYGSPLAEFLIGLFAYFFGGEISAFICYVLFVFSLNFLFCYFYNNENKSLTNYKFYFYALCLTNPVLLFDNVNPSDFAISLFFFSFGLFILKTKYKLFSSILFGFAIASRANYAAFVIIILILEFLFNKKNNALKDSILIFLNTTIIMCLFYLPITILHKLKIDYISNPGGPEFKLAELFPRFFYKFYLLFGVYNSLLFVCLFLIGFIGLNQKNIKKFVIDEKNLIGLVLINTLIFFFIPSKTAIISMVIILFYILLIKNFGKKLLLSIVFFNVLYWVVSYQLFDFKYKYSGLCDPIIFVDKEFNFKVKEGFFFEKKKQLLGRIKCNSVEFKDKDEREKYLRGEKLFGSKSILTVR